MSIILARPVPLAGKNEVHLIGSAGLMVEKSLLDMHRHKFAWPHILQNLFQKAVPLVEPDKGTLNVNELDRV